MPPAAGARAAPPPGPQLWPTPVARIRTGNACGGRRAPAGLRHRADLSGPYPRQNYGARAGRPHAVPDDVHREPVRPPRPGLPETGARVGSCRDLGEVDGCATDRRSPCIGPRRQGRGAVGRGAEHRPVPDSTIREPVRAAEARFVHLPSKSARPSTRDGRDRCRHRVERSPRPARAGSACRAGLTRRSAAASAAPRAVRSAGAGAAGRSPAVVSGRCSTSCRRRKAAESDGTVTGLRSGARVCAEPRRARSGAPVRRCPRSASRPRYPWSNPGSRSRFRTETPSGPTDPR